MLCIFKSTLLFTLSTNNWRRRRHLGSNGLMPNILREGTSGVISLKTFLIAKSLRNFFYLKIRITSTPHSISSETEFPTEVKRSENYLLFSP